MCAQDNVRQSSVAGPSAIAKTLQTTNVLVLSRRMRIMPLISLPWTSLASDVQGREISGMTTTMGRSRVRGAVFGANDIAQLQVLEKDAVRHHGDAPLGPSHEPIHERQCAPRHCGVVLFLCEHGVLFLNDLCKVHARPRAFERRSRRAPLRRVDSNALAAQLTRYQRSVGLRGAETERGSLQRARQRRHHDELDIHPLGLDLCLQCRALLLAGRRERRIPQGGRIKELLPVNVN